MKQHFREGVLYLGASMIASAAGIGYDSRQKLWRRILGTEPEKEPTPMMSWGVEHEADAIASYEILTGSLVVAQQDWFVHPQHPFIGSTLDGMTHDRRTTVEAKCPANIYAEPPAMYAAQCIAQRECAGAEDSHLIAWTPQGSRIWRIGPSAEFREWLLAEAVKFWSFVESNTEPPRQRKPTPPAFDFELLYDTAAKEAA